MREWGVCPSTFRGAIQVVYRFSISKQFMGYFFDQVAFPGPTLSKNEHEKCPYFALSKISCCVVDNAMTLTFKVFNFN